MKTQSFMLRFCGLLLTLSCFCNTSAADSGQDFDQLTPAHTFKDCPDCPEMTAIPAGKFVLNAAGSPRTIAVSQSFALGKYEVTFEEWDACVAAGGCGGYRPSDEGWGRERRPAMNISWQDANLYAQWLSQKTGRHYRLPSEAEWEYAARGGLSPRHLKGGLPGGDSANCDNCVGQWANLQTAPVGRLEANVFGLFDTHGNVWEWVSDCADCECETRILRGAALGNDQSVSSASRRLRNSGSDRNGHAGLRIAMSLEPAAAAPAPQQPEEARTTSSLIPLTCGKSIKAEPKCKPSKEIYRIEVLDKPIMIEGAFFDTDSAVLKPEGKEKLDMVVEFAEKYRDTHLDVVGHTDSTGSEAWNRELSAARAASVKNYLVGNGVDADRISTRGAASTLPITSNEATEGKAKNRRVEIRSAVRIEKKILME